MSVLLTMVVVIKSVITLWDLFSAAAIEDTTWILIEWLALVGPQSGNTLYVHIFIYALLFFIDINECSLNTDGCDQVCINTMGSFQCSCNRGYTLNTDEITCTGTILKLTWYETNKLLCLTVDVNECALNNGGCEQVCNNSVGSFQCSCNRGYRLNLDRMNCSGNMHAQLEII